MDVAGYYVVILVLVHGVGVWCGEVKIGRFSFFDRCSSSSPLHLLFPKLFLFLLLVLFALFSSPPFLIHSVSSPTLTLYLSPIVTVYFTPMFSPFVTPLREMFRKGGTVTPMLRTLTSYNFICWARVAGNWQRTSSFPQAASFCFFPLPPLRLSAPSPACEPSAPSTTPSTLIMSF
jgi:hypothetical protein